MAEQPWYQSGLRFECEQCGQCCTGDPGFVWVSDDEIAALAKELGFSLAEFEERFVMSVGRRKSLVELKNGDCILFDNEKRACRIYEGRPIQCRTWPFWRSNLETPESWADTAERCPGCNRGKVVPVGEIERQAREKKL